MQDIQTVPYGFCQCGCGKKTRISKGTVRRNGYVKGRPLKYVLGHNRRSGIVTAEGRECCACHEFQPWDNFFKGVSAEGKFSRCKSCCTRLHLKVKYGSADIYDTLLEKQNGLCLLCEKPEEQSKNQRLYVDHDHNCSQGHPTYKGCINCIRGLLCNQCNSVILPLVERAPKLIYRFEDYLSRRPLMGLP